MSCSAAAEVLMYDILESDSSSVYDITPPISRSVVNCKHFSRIRNNLLDIVTACGRSAQSCIMHKYCFAMF